MVDALSDSLANQIDQRLDLQEAQKPTTLSLPSLVNRAATTSLDESLDFPTVCATGSINVGTTKGSVLFSSFVSPINFSSDSFQSRLSYVARLFAQWNGTIRLSMVFTKVIFQQLKLIIAYHPGMSDLEAFNSTDVDSLAALQYSKIFNPNNDVQVDFDIPFICPSIWCNMASNIGCISVRIFQPLVASSNDINSIYWTMRVCRSPISPTLSFRNVLPVPYLPAPGPGPSPGPTPHPVPPSPDSLSPLDVALNVFASPCYGGVVRNSLYTLEQFTGVVFIPPEKLDGVRLLSRYIRSGSSMLNVFPGTLMCKVKTYDTGALDWSNWPREAYVGPGDDSISPNMRKFYVPIPAGQVRVKDQILIQNVEKGNWFAHVKEVHSKYVVAVSLKEDQAIVGSDSKFTPLHVTNDIPGTIRDDGKFVACLTSVSISHFATCAKHGLMSVEPFLNVDMDLSSKLGWNNIEATLFVGRTPVMRGHLLMLNGIFIGEFMPGINELSDPKDIFVQPLGPNVYFRFGKFNMCGMANLPALRTYLS